ncbi:unnamed protein product, partial [Amoebophrya sp. A25]
FPHLHTLSAAGNLPGLCGHASRYRRHVLRAVKNAKILTTLDGIDFQPQNTDAYYADRAGGELSGDERTRARQQRLEAFFKAAE